MLDCFQTHVYVQHFKTALSIVSTYSKPLLSQQSTTKVSTDCVAASTVNQNRLQIISVQCFYPNPVLLVHVVQSVLYRHLSETAC